MCIRDSNYADGTAISWIWDVNFEVLLNMGSNLTRVLVSGVRADDMALRLYYAGIPKEKILVIHDYDKLIDTMLA